MTFLNKTLKIQYIYTKGPAEKIIRIAYNQSSIVLRDEEDFMNLNYKIPKQTPLLGKLQKREDFSKNNKETQNFIVFVLDKTMRQRHLTKIHTLYDYLVETKINSKK